MPDIEELEARAKKLADGSKALADRARKMAVDASKPLPFTEGERENQRELITKLNALARRANGGKKPTPESWKSLFSKYDRDKDGLVRAGELETLLDDADVGNWMTRSMWVSSIIERVDAANQRDGGVSLDEFMRVLKSMPDPDLTADGLARVKKLVGDEFTPSFSFDGGLFLLLGIGALVLLVDRK